MSCAQTICIVMSYVLAATTGGLLVLSIQDGFPPFFVMTLAAMGMCLVGAFG